MQASRDQEQVAMSLYNLEHLELLRDPLTSTKCLVAWGADTCVIAFRGTANKQNATHDVKVMSILYCKRRCSELFTLTAFTLTAVL